MQPGGHRFDPGQLHQIQPSAKIMPKVADWPMWLPVLILGPHALLAGILLWAWRPKSDKEWRRFGILAAYQVLFWTVMYFVFGFR